MALETWLQDMRYGVRLMRRSPAFSLTAVLVLSLGIGVNTALFSIVNALFFPDRHIPRPADVFLMYQENLSRQTLPFFAHTSEDELLLNRDLADYSATWTLTLRVGVGDEVEPANGENVAAAYFDVVGVSAALGRTFRHEDHDVSITDKSIVVSDAFWKRRLRAMPSPIGQRVRVNDAFYTVIGVMPPAFGGLGDALHPTECWMANEQFSGGRFGLGTIGRLKPDVTFEQLRRFIESRVPQHRQERVDGLPPERREGYKDWLKFARVPVYRLTDVSDIRDPEARLIAPKVLTALTTVVALVLVIASANIAGLLLARGVTRTSEVAVRRALGAGGARLVRQLLTESVMLATAGGIVGGLFAWMLVALFRALTPPSFVVAVGVDYRVLLFAMALCVGAGVLVGLAPALQAIRVNVLEALGAGIAGSRRVRTRLRHAIVIPQVALSLVLLVVAALHVRALLDIELDDLGYRTRDGIVLTVGRWEPVPSFSTRPADRQRQNEDAARMRAFNRNLLARLERVPGLTSFALASRLPLQAWRGELAPVITEEAQAAGQTSRAGADQIVVSDNYFDAMGMQLQRGRTFDGRDGYGGTPATVISDRLARALWPTGDPIGRLFAFQPSSPTATIAWLEVIGVVNEVDPVIETPVARPAAYISLLQQWRGWAPNLVVRGNGEMPAIIRDVKAAVLGADTFAEVSQVRTLRQMVGDILYPRRAAAGILATAGLIGLALACIGLYGVISYSVAQRRREIGIRATLGADRGDIIGLVLREGAAVTLLGTAAGGVLTFVALRLSANLIPGVPLLDVVSFVSVPALLMLIVLAACVIPARRAAGTDPAKVLRA